MTQKTRMPQRLRDMTYRFPGLAGRLMEEHPSSDPTFMYWPCIEDLERLKDDPTLAEEDQHAARFLLEIWDGSGDFRLRDAMATWRDAYRWVFLLWATGKDAQPLGRRAPWLPVDTPPWFPHT